MKIKVSKFEEVLLSLLAICGEVDEKYLLSRLDDSSLKGYSVDYAKHIILDMDAKHLINRKSYTRLGSKRKYIRLSSIKGYDAVRQISDELMPHFSLMAGDENNRYKGNAVRLRRKRDTMFLALTHLLDGFLVDYLSLDFTPREYPEFEPMFRKSVFDRNGLLIKPENVIAKTEKRDRAYITSGALKDIGNKASSIFKGRSQYTGLILALPLSFICYYIPYPEYTWNSLEEQFKMLIASHIRKQFGEGMKPPAAIFYMPDVECYCKFINLPAKVKLGNARSRRLNPADIFDAGYLLPIGGTNYREIREILLMERGQEMLSQVVLGDNYIDNPDYDGIFQGCKVYNLLLCDFVKMQKIKNSVREEASIVIIHKWQEEAMREYYGEDTELIAVDEEYFVDCLMEINERFLGKLHDFELIEKSSKRQFLQCKKR